MSRIDVFKQILESDPSNSNVLFGLAKEYEKAGEDKQLIGFSIDISRARMMRATLTECWRLLTSDWANVTRQKSV